MDILHTACFTGHRPQNLGINENSSGFRLFMEDLEYTILELVSFKGITTFISGMALGVDMYAAQTVLKIKERNRLLITPHIGWAAVEARTRLMKTIEAQVCEFFEKCVE